MLSILSDNYDYEFVKNKIVNENRNVFLSGPGGTGKSHLAKKLFQDLTNDTESKYIVKIGATTGAAALLIEGRTLHSVLGLGLGTDSVDTYVLRINKNKVLYSLWTSPKLLLIFDEISMLGGSLFKKMNEIGKKIRKNEKFMGGIQLLFIGDFYQLPPVKDTFIFLEPCWNYANFYIYEMNNPYRYDNNDFFQLLMRIRDQTITPEDIKLIKTRVITKDQFKLLTSGNNISLNNDTIEHKNESNCSICLEPLKNQTILLECFHNFHRTCLQKLIKLNHGSNYSSTSSTSSNLTPCLNTNLIKGLNCPECRNPIGDCIFHELYHNDENIVPKIIPTLLYSCKKDTNQYNLTEIHKLCSDTFSVYHSKDQLFKKDRFGNKVYETLENTNAYDTILDQFENNNIHKISRFKVNAQVMLTCNAFPELGLINGSRGVITSCEPDHINVLFKNHNMPIRIDPWEWSVMAKEHGNSEFGKIYKKSTLYVSRTQIPLILAWALTIHRAQGATLDSCILDIGDSIFTYGQVYVAISRCKNLDSIYLLNFNETKIMANPDVIKFFE
jgi:ATP-dependent DNA helicase PIF1